MPIAVALRLVWRNGSATLTTVPSMNAMLDASIVAASIHLPNLFYPCNLWLKRLVNRCALFREKLWSIRRDVQAVFQTNSKLAVDHDCRFITETHSRLDRRLVAAHEVGPFMTI